LINKESEQVFKKKKTINGPQNANNRGTVISLVPAIQ